MLITQGSRTRLRRDAQQRRMLLWRWLLGGLRDQILLLPGSFSVESKRCASETKGGRIRRPLGVVANVALVPSAAMMRCCKLE